MTEGDDKHGNCHRVQWLLEWLPCALVILQMLCFPFSHNCYFTLLRSGHLTND
ncbi:hypothetical protein BDZ89DRAFT_1072730 [Hymenopellis radicata]|nr:hypothetical protein BDZ89DRAFT_1072730 [Hymenopellis radicata]